MNGKNYVSLEVAKALRKKDLKNCVIRLTTKKAVHSIIKK